MAAETGGARRRVAIFGGSFNPPHKGHSEIVKWLFMKGLADELWAVPCYIHALGKGLAPFEHRLAMARLAFSRYGLPVGVTDVEAELGGPSVTLRTLTHLMEHNPDNRFSIVTGSDVDGEIHRWHSFEKIKELADIIRIPRGPDSPITDVSSTEIREMIAAGDPAWRKMVEPEVAVYIVTKALYRE